jgi:hypothetical protein
MFADCCKVKNKVYIKQNHKFDLIDYINEKPIRTRKLKHHVKGLINNQFINDKGITYFLTSL